MSDLPHELLFDILLLLSPEDLIRCMCVSKSWNASIRDQRFIKEHHERSIKTNSSRTLLLVQWNLSKFPKDLFSLDFYDNDTFGTPVKIAQPLEQQFDKGTGLHIVGYSNGLVCIKNKNDDVAFWNPSIQKFKKIPFTTFEPLPSSNLKTDSLCIYGFGYDSANDDYKLVRMIEFYHRGDTTVSSEVKVYSLKSNSWKRIQTRENDDICMLLVCGGYLCLSGWRPGISRDVWIMKEYGVTESWTLLFSIKEGDYPHPLTYFKPLLYSKNGQMVLVRREPDMFFWFDLEKKNAEPVEISSLPRFDGAICAVGSLSLLDGDLVIDKRQRTMSSL